VRDTTNNCMNLTPTLYLQSEKASFFFLAFFYVINYNFKMLAYIYCFLTQLRNLSIGFSEQQQQQKYTIYYRKKANHELFFALTLCIRSFKIDRSINASLCSTRTRTNQLYGETRNEINLQYTIYLKIHCHNFATKTNKYTNTQTEKENFQQLII
jgi:hypothetical protein